MALSRSNLFGMPRSPFDDFFRNEPVFSQSLIPFLRDDHNDFWRRHDYQIQQDDETYKLSIDLPGVRTEDMNLNLEEDGRVLHLTGGRKVQTDNGGTSETRFDHRFTVADNVETEKLSAHLENGVLSLTAPKKKPEPPAVKKIAIQEGPVGDTSKLTVKK